MTNKYKTKKFRREHFSEVKPVKKIDKGPKIIISEPKNKNPQLRNDLTKIFVLTMLAVGLEVALKLLWR